MVHKNTIIFSKIIKYAEETLEFSNSIDYDSFENDRKTIAACVFNLSQIGELSKNIDKNIRTLNKEQ